MKNHITTFLLALVVLGQAFVLTAADLTVTPQIQAKLDAQIKVIQEWANNPIVVKAVKTQNAALPEAYTAMNQDKWTALTILDPFVRGFAKNEAGQFLKSKRTELITQAFISDANGIKVAFLDKTANWCHKGAPKHDVPLTGKNWQGKPELGAASGAQQIQISVPVMDGDKPIGSLVVGLGLAKLSE